MNLKSKRSFQQNMSVRSVSVNNYSSLPQTYYHRQAPSYIQTFHNYVQPSYVTPPNSDSKRNNRFASALSEQTSSFNYGKIVQKNLNSTPSSKLQ